MRSDRRRVRAAGLAALAVMAMVFGAALAISPWLASAQAAATPASCTVGVDILSIHAINFDANTFDMEF